MNIGIVVEGADDYWTYPALAKRIRMDIGRLQIRECGGKSRLKGRFPGFLKEFQNPAWQIERAFVIRDSDCNPPKPIEEQLRSMLNASGRPPGLRVEFFAVPCMLESWLLSDLHSIREIAGRRGHAAPVRDLGFQIATMQSSDDKELFSRVLAHFSLPATPAVYKEIAESIDFTAIGRRCAYFEEFARRIRA